MVSNQRTSLNCALAVHRSFLVLSRQIPAVCLRKSKSFFFCFFFEAFAVLQKRVGRCNSRVFLALDIPFSNILNAAFDSANRPQCASSSTLHKELPKLDGHSCYVGRTFMSTLNHAPAFR